MPHECTTCGRTFQDGSKEMLSGCPECGGNKFQFHPGGSTQSETTVPGSDSEIKTETPGEATESAVRDDTDSEFETPNTDVASADNSLEVPATDDGGVGFDDSALDPEPPNAEAESSTETPTSTGSSFSFGPQSDGDAEERETDDGLTGSHSETESREDRAQASARKTVVGPEELEAADVRQAAIAEETQPAQTEPTDAQPDDQPDLSDLREELNDQFESIKIHAPGEYELNLMELYDREEHIIALQEDGRYVIDVPGSWRDRDDAE